MIQVKILGSGDILMTCDCGIWSDVVSKTTLARPLGEALIGFTLLLGLGHVQSQHALGGKASVSVADTVPQTQLPPESVWGKWSTFDDAGRG